MDAKCGVCGDPINGPRDNEAPNGKYFTGIPTYTYKAGSVIDVRVDMMANHLGWFFFKICPVTNNMIEVTQDCLDQHPLEIVEAPTTPTTPYMWEIPGTYTPSVAPGWNLPSYSFKVQLPPGLTCDRCVLQWDWPCANHNGTSDGKQGIGYGPQSDFRGCADVRIEN